MGYAWLNLGSLLCGLAGWIVPCLGLWMGKGPSSGRQGMAAAVSLSLCGLALWLQQRYQQHLAEIQDWSATLDTSGAGTAVSAFLLITTALFNLLLLAAAGRGEKEV